MIRRLLGLFLLKWLGRGKMSMGLSLERGSASHEDGPGLDSPLILSRKAGKEDPFPGKHTYNLDLDGPIV